MATPLPDGFKSPVAFVQKCEKKVVQLIQDTQQATPNKRTKPKEKANRGNRNIYLYDKVIHRRHTRQWYIKIGKQWEYRPGTGSGECRCAFHYSINSPWPK